jgi:hypothetical protein
LPRLVATDAANVYWLDRDRGTVSKVSKNGGPTQVLAVGPFVESSYRPEEAQIAVVGDSLYFTRIRKTTTESTYAEQVVRMGTGGEGLEVLLESQEPSLARSGAGVLIEDDQEVYAASSSGLRALGELTIPQFHGHLRDPRSLQGYGWLRPECLFVPTEGALFYSACDDEYSYRIHALFRQSSVDGSLRISMMGYRFRDMAAFVDDPTGLYFVEVGHMGLPPRRRRVNCCSIWWIPKGP